MRFDPTGMTPQQRAEMVAQYESMYGRPGMAPSAVTKKPDKDPFAGTAYAGTAGIKGQQVSGISDLGYEPEFVPPQELSYTSDLGYEPEPPANQNLQSIMDSLGPPRTYTANTGNSTGTLGINPDTGETFLPDSQPPGDPPNLDDIISDDAGFFGPRGGLGPRINNFGGPPMGGGKGGYRPPMYGGGFGGPQYGNPYGGGFGRPQYGNPYGGGFGRPPMGGGKGGGRPPMYGNPYGGNPYQRTGFGRPQNRYAPLLGTGGGGFGGNFPSPYASQQYRQDVARSGIPPGFVQDEMQTGNSTGYTNPQTGETMSIPVDFSGGRMAAPGYNLATGTFDGPGVTQGPQQPTNPYSTGYGMGYQQQPNQQPMGGGKGGTQSGGGKGGAQ